MQGGGWNDGNGIGEADDRGHCGGNSIALLTGPWSADRTIVYRVYNRYLQALAREYDVTLIQLNVPLAQQDYVRATDHLIARVLFGASVYGWMGTSRACLGDGQPR